MITLRSGAMVNAGGIIAPRVPTVADLHIAAHGDSMTRDVGLSNYIYQLKTLVNTETGEHAQLTQRGINGISFNFKWEYEQIDETLLTDAPDTIDTAIEPSIDNWLIVWGGINGMAIGLHSAATEYADFKTYIAARIAAGWDADKIIVVTLTPRSGFTDTTRQTFNASLVGDDGSYGYRLARTDLNANIGDAGDEANTTYFYDGIHLTAAGHAIVAQIIYDTMFP